MIEAKPVSGKKELADVAILGALRTILTPQQLRELVQDCIFDATDRLAAVEAALHDMNADVLRRSAHDLRGVSGNFGLSVMSDAAAELERSCMEGDHARMQVAAAQLLSCAQASMDYLANFDN